eukprot:m.130766 g.130766  ORF g.130766 m.130766 type:complete len:507 (+) comp11291_c1_seq1:1404-2924(+)
MPLTWSKGSPKSVFRRKPERPLRDVKASRKDLNGGDNRRLARQLAEAGAESPHRTTTSTTMAISTTSASSPEPANPDDADILLTVCDFDSESSDSSSGAGKTKVKPPSLAIPHERVLSPRESGRGSNTVLSPHAHNIAPFDADNEVRERETIDPKELPRVGAPLQQAFTRESTLQWAPRPAASGSAEPADNHIADYIHRMANLNVPEERALLALWKNKFNFGRARKEALLQSMKYARPPVSIDCFQTVDFANWTQSERLAFERAFIQRGKKFGEICKSVGTKTVHECVEFYYIWKKTKQGTRTRRLRRDVLGLPVTNKVPRQLFVPMSCIRQRSTGKSHHKKRDTKDKKEDKKDRKDDKKPRALKHPGEPAEPDQPPPPKKSHKKKVPPPPESSSTAPPRSFMTHKKRKVEPEPPSSSRSVGPVGGAAAAGDKEDKVAKSQTPTVLPDEYVVEAIVAARKRGKKREYFIKWEGYDHVDNTWEPEDNLKNNTILEQWKRTTLDGQFT